MEDFEQKLSRLEELSSAIKQTDISLEDALKAFEEGIKLARSMQQYLDEMEGKVQILMNPQAVTNSAEQEQNEKESAPSSKSRKESTKASKTQGSATPELGLFDETSEVKGTRS